MNFPFWNRLLVNSSPSNPCSVGYFSEHTIQFPLAHPPQVSDRKPTRIMLCEVVNGKAGDQAYIVDDSGVNGVFVAVLDVRAFFSIVPRRVGGHELSFTLQSHIVSLKDEFWYDSEFRLI